MFCVVVAKAASPKKTKAKASGKVTSKYYCWWISVTVCNV